MLLEPRPDRTSQAEDWSVVGTATDQVTAEMWRGLLDAAGVPSMLAPDDAVSFLGVSAAPCRVLVPEHLIGFARDVLEAQLGPAGAPEQEQDA